MMRKDLWYEQDRRSGLRRFATAVTVLIILGHTVLGFEQSWAHPLAALAGAYGMELLMELVDAGLNRRRLRFAGGFMPFVDFLLPAHISGLVISMLIYANQRLMPVAFAAAVAIASKGIVRLWVGDRPRHVLNPSNFGITLTLLLFPWVGIAPPYHYTENLAALGDWVLPGIIVLSGTFLNWRYTRRLPLLAAWMIGFTLQAVVRHLAFNVSLASALSPMTGMAFLLFAFYMVTDPPTTPAGLRGQIVFGGAVAAAYGVLIAFHIVFGFFFALTIVTVVRLAFVLAPPMPKPQPELVPQSAPVLKRPEP